MDYVFSMADDDGRPGALTDVPPGPGPAGAALDRAAGLLAKARRPVIMAGTNLWWGHGEAALLRLAEQRQIPVLMNGMVCGAVPADHPLAFSRVRGKALGRPMLRSSSACRWTSGWASARCSARTRSWS